MPRRPTAKTRRRGRPPVEAQPEAPINMVYDEAWHKANQAPVEPVLEHKSDYRDHPQQYADMFTSRPPLLGYTAQVLKSMHDLLVERGSTYNDFSDNTTRMVRILEALGITFPDWATEEVAGALLHIAAKLSRIPESPEHRDNWLDLANYGVLGLSMNDRTAAIANRKP